MTAAAIQDFLYRECGLKGLSGISNDVRERQSSSDPRAAFALDHFCYRVCLNAGTLAAALGGVDAFVFTAGLVRTPRPSARALPPGSAGWAWFWMRKPMGRMPLVCPRPTAVPGFTSSRRTRN
jgi:acetate kinase